MGKGLKRTKAWLADASVGGVRSMARVSFLFIAFRKAGEMVSPDPCTVEFVAVHRCCWPSSSPSYSSSSKLVIMIPVTLNVRTQQARGQHNRKLTIFLWLVPRRGRHLDVVHLGRGRFDD